ncbi:hypothetical protein [Aeromicrobium sp. CTD01-1L150]|uniref:hypothetical protein n=1 Tax=Aeromicrobium sp. CTD01-1L150 TaxID=3341830 RepID=UPI0035C1256C
MTNSSKSKGDRGEREAVAVLKHLSPHLLVDRPDRFLGAGRKDDEGDLRVFPDTSVQVKAWGISTIGTALRSAAAGAERQRLNARFDLGVGLVPIPRARNGTVRWLAAVQTSCQWPTPVIEDPVEFSMISRLLAWLRDDAGPHGYLAIPRHERIGLLCGGNSATDIYVAPLEAWLAAYETYRQIPLRSTG